MRIFSSLSLALLCALHVNAYTYKLSEYITVGGSQSEEVYVRCWLTSRP